jgi:rare lipoprotein A
MKNSLIIPILMMGLVASSSVSASKPSHNNVVKHDTGIQNNNSASQTTPKHTKFKKRLTSARANNMLGMATWYGYESGKRYRHRPKTASGEYFNPNELTAAHRTIPFGSMVLVTNLVNNKTVVVKINDRGPFAKGRIIDLSRAAANAIDIKGVGKVSLTIK